jgi:transposase
VIRIVLSLGEVELLQAYCRTSPLKLLRAKSQAVLLKSRQVKIKDIAFSLGVGYRTVERWIKDFSLQRIASIFTGHANNENAGKLTREQKEQIREVLNQPPTAYGLPREFWDVPALKDYIKAEFGVVYESVQSYHFLLKFSNLTFKYPDKFDLHRDEEKILKTMEELREKIKVYLKDPQWEVFASDETRIILEALTRRAWLRKGKRTIIRVERSKDYQNYIGFLNQKSFKCELYELAWQNQEEIINALKILIKKYPHKRVCLVWDNARFHKGKKIRKELKMGNSLEKIYLLNFPPYAPDMNPIEHVWKAVKDRISNQQYRNFEMTKQQFRTTINTRTFSYKI